MSKKENPADVVPNIAEWLSALGERVTVKSVREQSRGGLSKDEISEKLEHWKKKKVYRFLREAMRVAEFANDIVDSVGDIAKPEYIRAALYGASYAQDAQAVAKKYAALLSAARSFLFEVSILDKEVQWIRNAGKG